MPRDQDRDDRLDAQTARSWCLERHLPLMDPVLQRELVHLVTVMRQAIDDEPDLIPREVRVYYQALKYIAAVSGDTGKPSRRKVAPLITERQRQAAANLDAKVRRLRQQGYDDLSLLGKMAEEMATFKWLMDSTGQGGMDALCTEFDGFYYFALILERLAGDIAAGRIQVP